MLARKIGRDEAGQKLLRYLRKVLPKAPDSFLYKMLRKRNIVLQKGKRCAGDEVLKDGDQVCFFLSPETFQAFGGTLPAAFDKPAADTAKPEGENPDSPKVPDSPEPGGKLPTKGKGQEAARPDLQRAGVVLVYEDDDFLFVSKPAGLLVQGDRGGDMSLAALLKSLKVPGSTTVCAPMHRLDRNTTGLVLCAKTVKAQTFLARALRERTIRKDYLAVCKGHLPREGRFRAYHLKDERTNTVRIFEQKLPKGLPIETEFREMARREGYSLVRARLVTGRAHQIRAHLAYLGCPVLGDGKYGGKDAAFSWVPWQCLHAWRVTFDEDTGEFPCLSGKTFLAPLPETMKGVLNQIGFREPENEQ